MSSTVSITYELNSPSDTPTPPFLSAKNTLKYPVSTATDGKAYYEALRIAVLQAKNVLGEQLTSWRDAVGKREDNKEAKIPQKSEEEEDEDEPEQ